MFLVFRDGCAHDDVQPVRVYLFINEHHTDNVWSDRFGIFSRGQNDEFGEYDQQRQVVIMSSSSRWCTAED